MLRRAITTVARGNNGGAIHQHWRNFSHKSTTTTATAASSAVNSIISRSLKDQVSNMSPPPKVSPPAEFIIAKGALDSNGPVLKRQFKNEEINISVMRLVNTVEKDVNDNDEGNGRINPLFLHVDVSKLGKKESLSFLCGLYPDAIDIHLVSLRSRPDGSVFVPNVFSGPLFENLDEKTRDAFHNYIEERGINGRLFPFFQAWLYVKDHQNLLRWFKSVGSVISGQEAKKEIEQPKGASAVTEPKGFTVDKFMRWSYRLF